jgi:prepilin-type N-terminal cleavage/methylation domain-containing protein
VTSARGITLIELIVVMAILSVVLAFVGPSVSTGIDNIILTSEGQRVLSAFRLAQNKARNTGERVFATYDETSLRFFKGDQTYQTVTLTRGTRLVLSDKTPTLVFLESGQIVGPDAIELLSDHGRRLQLSFNHATGLIKMANGS